MPIKKSLYVISINTIILMTFVFLTELISIFVYNSSYKSKDPMLINSWRIFYSFNYQENPYHLEIYI